MEILIRQLNPQEHDLVTLFGKGMIGAAISEALERLGYKSFTHVPIAWTNRKQRELGLDEVHRICLGIRSSVSRMSWVWSASGTNFFSADRDTALEQESFEAILHSALKLKQEFAPLEFGAHFLSSAGGLFEGQKTVDNCSEPAPRRAYGRMKVVQEKILQEVVDEGELSIYRPSSVYGPINVQRKHGLINALIFNAYNRRTSILDANVMALRDYVYSGDIANYVARRTALNSAGESNREEINFLVSARCASIYEIVARIERIMKLKVRARYDEFFGNNADITFDDSVLPGNWKPSSLEAGIRQFILKDNPQARAIHHNAESLH